MNRCNRKVTFFAAFEEWHSTINLYIRTFIIIYLLLREILLLRSSTVRHYRNENNPGKGNRRHTTTKTTKANRIAYIVQRHSELYPFLRDKHNYICLYIHIHDKRTYRNITTIIITTTITIILIIIIVIITTVTVIIIIIKNMATAVITILIIVSKTMKVRWIIAKIK